MSLNNKEQESTVKKEGWKSTTSLASPKNRRSEESVKKNSGHTDLLFYAQELNDK